MKFVKSALVLTLALSGAAFANDAKPHEDAAKMASATVKTRTVQYVCQGGKKVSVKYGFNKQNLPTYAEAKLNGKTRFMPINLHYSNDASTEFGDENNFSLAAEAFNYGSVKKASVSISAPDSEILYKVCNPKGKR